MAYTTRIYAKDFSTAQLRGLPIAAGPGAFIQIFVGQTQKNKRCLVEYKQKIIVKIGTGVLNVRIYMNCAILCRKPTQNSINKL